MGTDTRPTLDDLRGVVLEGSTVYTILRHVSRSGMQRRISLIVIDSHGEPRHLDGTAARALGRRFHPDGGVVCNGAGMDMGFDLVYSLARVLYGDGYALNHRWL